MPTDGPRPAVLAAVQGLNRADLVEFIDRLWDRVFCCADDLDRVAVEVRRGRIKRLEAAAWAQYEAGLASLKADYPDGLPSACTAAGAAARLDYLRRHDAASRAADRSFALNERLAASFGLPATVEPNDAD